MDFHIIFSDKVTQQEIDNFLRNADANVGGTEKKLADLKENDFNKAVVNFDQLLECLEKESLKLRGKYLLGFLSRGHGSSRSSSNYEKIVKKVHFLIHSSINQEKLKKDREFWLKCNKSLLQSSDAHKEEQIGKKYTWIKAEKTFEGLKQIIYEPETRVSIDKEKSQDPLYKIDSVGLNFDEEVKTTNEQDDTPFCYAGFNETLFFSPYFTYVIGGRGSGKSTLLQLIASAIKNKKQSKEGFLTFIKELKRIVNFESKENMEEKNSYDKVYNQLKQDICKKLEEIDADIKNGRFKSDEENIEKLELEHQTLLQEIGEFLKEKGVSDESIGDVRNANYHLANIKKNIDDLKHEIKEIANKIENFSYEDMDKNIEEFKNQINKELSKINSAFEEISKNHKEVKPITIEYRLNEDIFEEVFEDFDKLVDKGFNAQRHQSKIKEYLKEIELKNVTGMQHAEFIEELYNSIDNKKAAFYETLKDILDREIHFQIYRILILKHLRNVEKYKIFKVRYDKRALNETSFGQKCTAVLVVLLSLGNNPIIIDEPEAHLDSALIANYLVALIKKQKQKRQIIFATHNANFVLNADSELIIQLKNENNKIVAQSFMIESDAYKEDLLKLEGGEKAFKDRERKYGITKDKTKNKE